jgi:hypothetical protein
MTKKLEWQPIEIAKENDIFLVPTGGVIGVCIAHKNGDYISTLDFYPVRIFPKYWMPLPPPPKETL